MQSKTGKKLKEAGKLVERSKHESEHDRVKAKIKEARKLKKLKKDFKAQKSSCNWVDSSYTKPKKNHKKC